MSSETIPPIVQSIIDGKVVEKDEIITLRRWFYGDGIIHAEDALALFKANAVLTGAALNSTAFVEALTDYVVYQLMPTGRITAEKAGSADGRDGRAGRLRRDRLRAGAARQRHGRGARDPQQPRRLRPGPGQARRHHRRGAGSPGPGAFLPARSTPPTSSSSAASCPTMAGHPRAEKPRSWFDIADARTGPANDRGLVAALRARHRQPSARPRECRSSARSARRPRPPPSSVRRATGRAWSPADRSGRRQLVAVAHPSRRPGQQGRTALLAFVDAPVGEHRLRPPPSSAWPDLRSLLPPRRLAAELVRPLLSAGPSWRGVGLTAALSRLFEGTAPASMRRSGPQGTRRARAATLLIAASVSIVASPGQECSRRS